MTDTTWMLYGANGYTGQLIAEEALRRGMRPLLAGRRPDAVRPLAERLGLPWKTFALDSPDVVAGQLDGVSAVVLAAGPFSATSAPVVEACLRRGVHYLDITGEIEVFEACHRRSDEARARGVVVMPGVGFDVVPSDCLAAALAEALPGASRLELAFSSSGGFSRGTAKTAIEGMIGGGAIRQGGRITRVPVGWRVKEVPFRDHPRTVASIPWGDVSTAYHSTHIPEIVVYMALPRRAARGLKAMRYLAPVLRVNAVQELLKAAVDRAAPGPSESVRQHARSQLWGRVEHADGRAVEGTLVTPEGYQLTMLTTVESVARVLRGEVKSGAVTPSMAFGSRYITTFPDCDLRIA